MIEISTNENDDKDFVEIVQKILKYHIQNEFNFDEVYVVKIDNWFDFKWRSFAGKTLGAMGVWLKELRIPPFIPNRVVEQNYYRKLNDSYVTQNVNNLHINQYSEANFNRKIKLASNSALFLWFSGETKNTLRGSLMCYQIEGGEENSYYVSFEKNEYWKINKTDNISKNEVSSLIK